jgi:hypothetical protein
MDKPSFSPKNNPDAINEYHKLEIQEIFVRTRTSENIRIQVGIIFLTANVTLLGFAFSTQKVGLVFAAVIILFLWAIADFAGKRSIGVLYYRGLQLEKIYASEQDALLHIYIASTSSMKKLVEQLSSITEIKNQKDRIKALRSFCFSFSDYLLPIICITLELLAGVYLLNSGWYLF